MQVGDRDRVKKKVQERKRKGETKRERPTELNRIGPTVVACLQAVRPRIFVPYIPGTFGDSAVGCSKNEGRGHKAPTRSRHVVHASIKVHVESHARPARRKPEYGCDRSQEKLGNTPTLG